MSRECRCSRAAWLHLGDAASARVLGVRAISRSARRIGLRADAHIDDGRRGRRPGVRYRVAGVARPEVPAESHRALAAEAAAAVAELGPAAMKVLSPDILHKTEAGAIQLDVTSPDMAAEVFGQILTAVGSTVRMPLSMAWKCSRWCPRALRCCSA